MDQRGGSLSHPLGLGQIAKVKAKKGLGIGVAKRKTYRTSIGLYYRKV
jgi:hypothetical protein